MNLIINIIYKNKKIYMLNISVAPYTYGSTFCAYARCILPTSIRIRLKYVFFNILYFYFNYKISFIIYQISYFYNISKCSFFCITFFNLKYSIYKNLKEQLLHIFSHSNIRKLEKFFKNQIIKLI